MILDADDPINGGLVGFWPLDEEGGRAFDLSPYRTTGALTGTPTHVGGLGGQVMRFSGSGQYVNLGTPPAFKTLQTPLTISAWVNPTSISGTKTIFGQYLSTTGGQLVKLLRMDGSFPVYYTSNGSGGYQNTTTDAVIAMSANTWQHVAVTMTAGLVATVHVNLRSWAVNLGAVYSSPDGTVTSNIGSNSSGTEAFSGDISRVRIWRRALNRNEVRRLWAEPNAGIWKRKFWSLKAGSGTTYNDTISDALTGAESLATALTAVASLTDALTGAETLASVLTAIGSLSDAGTVADSLATALTTAGTLADALTAAEAIATALTTAGVLSDDAAAADSIVGGLLVSATVSDDGTAAESLGAGLSIPTTISDATTGAESSATALTATATISGGVTAGDAMSGGATAYSDGLSIVARASDSMAVTGGRAISDGTDSSPSATGNTIQPPPRMTGNTDTDLRALTQWANHLYDQLVKAYNVTGRIVDHEERIAALETPTTIH